MLSAYCDLSVNADGWLATGVAPVVVWGPTILAGLGLAGLLWRRRLSVLAAFVLPALAWVAALHSLLVLFRG